MQPVASPPPTYRSEAFFEDLPEAESVPAPDGPRLEAWLGLLPLCTALLGFAFALF